MIKSTQTKENVPNRRTLLSKPPSVYRRLRFATKVLWILNENSILAQILTHSSRQGPWQNAHHRNCSKMVNAFECSVSHWTYHIFCTDTLVCRQNTFYSNLSICSWSQPIGMGLRHTSWLYSRKFDQIQFLCREVRRSWTRIKTSKSVWRVSFNFCTLRQSMAFCTLFCWHSTPFRWIRSKKCAFASGNRAKKISSPEAYHDSAKTCTEAQWVDDWSKIWKRSWKLIKFYGHDKILRFAWNSYQSIFNIRRKCSHGNGPVAWPMI